MKEAFGRNCDVAENKKEKKLIIIITGAVEELK